MAIRPRSALLAVAMAAASLTAAGVAPGSAVASPSQDPTTSAALTFGGDAQATTTAPATSTTEVEPTTSQEVTEGTSSESRLLTESRKLMATIGGLVIAAFGLMLLTLRYWRATAPVVEGAGAVGHVPTMGTEAALASASLAEAGAEPEPAPKPASEPKAATGTDHGRADDDYEPHGTGEHERVELPARSSRPGRAARAAALGRTTIR